MSCQSYSLEVLIGLGIIVTILCSVAITEASVVIWVKEDWAVLARLKYWSEVGTSDDDLLPLTIMFQGEPYLHVVNNLMVVPGLTKYTARVLMFDPRGKVVTRVRDLVHRQHWVLGAYIGQ